MDGLLELIKPKVVEIAINKGTRSAFLRGVGSKFRLFRHNIHPPPPGTTTTGHTCGSKQFN
jgi:hypothetical protein